MQRPLCLVLSTPIHPPPTPKPIQPHPALSLHLAQELLGVGSYEELLKLPAPPALLPMDTPASAKLQELLQRVRLERCAYMRLAVVRKGDPLESVFFSGLVEDRSAAGQSYVEYLCAVHRNIQNKMSS